MNRHWIALAAGLILFAGGQPNAQAARVAQHDATIATDWFRFALELVQTTPNTSPPVASRAFAYLGVTLYESVVPGMPEHRSLAGRLNGLHTLPTAEAGALDWPSVINTALSGVALELFPSQQERILEFERRHAKRSDSDMTERSIQHGRSLAAAIRTWAAEDGSQLRPPYEFSSLPGGWQPTAPGATALLPHWGRNRTFALASGTSCPVTAHTHYSEIAGTRFHTQALEVFRTSQALTAEQRAIALFWSDDPGRTATPGGHWISILTQVLEAKNTRLDVAAEAYARLGIALADAFIGCWNAKYQYQLLRPVTYIQRVLEPTWQPLLNTPSFPEFPSGHSVASAAAAQVLTALFGDAVVFTDRTHEPRGLPARTFNSFADAAREAAASRLYGGIHFRDAIELGLEQGRCIGSHASKLDLRQ